MSVANRLLTGIIGFAPLRQAYYYANEDTQETSWDAPIIAPSEEVAAARADTMGTASQDGGEENLSESLTNLTGIDHGTSNQDTMNAAPIDGGGEQDLTIRSTTDDIPSAVDAAQFQFPFYVNERGNRVFCIPRRTQS